MPILGIGISNRRRPNTTSVGFTLIEILMVLLIVGVLFTLAVWRVGGDSRERQLEKVARQIHRLLNESAEEAVLRSRQMGLYGAEDGYVLLAYQERWNRVGEAQQLPDGFWLEIAVEGTAIELYPLASDTRLNPPQEDFPADDDVAQDDDDENGDKEKDKALFSVDMGFSDDSDPSILRPHIFLLSSDEVLPDFELFVRDKELPGWRIALGERMAFALQRHQ